MARTNESNMNAAERIDREAAEWVSRLSRASDDHAHRASLPMLDATLEMQLSELNARLIRSQRKSRMNLMIAVSLVSRGGAFLAAMGLLNSSEFGSHVAAATGAVIAYCVTACVRQFNRYFELRHRVLRKESLMLVRHSIWKRSCERTTCEYERKGNIEMFTDTESSQ
jgi:hypothetical protein